MRTSTRMTFAAGWAAALGAVPLAAVFDSWQWLWYTWAAVAAVVAAHLLARSSRLPTALVPVAGALGLLLYLTLVFASQDALFGLIPTPSSLRALGTGVQDGMVDVHDLAAPVPAHAGLLLLTAGAVGLLTIALDIIAVVLRRPAAAGLPLLGLYAVPTAVARDGVKWPLFVIGALGYLILLMVEGRDRLLRWGRPVGQVAGARTAPTAGQFDEDATMPLTGQRIGAVALAIAVIGPLFVPGLTAHALSDLARTGSGDGGTGRAGGPVAINPFTQLKGRLDQANPVHLFHATTNQPGLFYLRTMVLSRYTTAGWQRSGTEAGDSAVGQIEPPTEQAEQFTNRPPFQVTVTVDKSYNGDTLPILYYPTRVDGVTADWRYDPGTAVLQNPTGLANSQQYTLTGFNAVPTVAQLEAATADFPSDIQRDWGSDRNVPDQVRAEVARQTKDKTTEYDKARALTDYFLPANGFGYSTQTVPGNSGNALVDFLTKKRGYCEQFASALGIMLRAAGIPSRVVIGFMHPTSGGVWDITTLDAHAWVEAYFPGVGWVPFDATPRDYSGVNRPAYAPGPAPTAAPSTNTGSNGGTGLPVAPSKGVKNGEPDASSPASSGSSGLLTAKVALISLGIVAVLALLLTPAIGRLTARRRRLRASTGADPRAAALAAWDEVLATAADYGVPMPRNETPRGTARRMAKELNEGPAVAGLRLLALAEERARYAPTAGVDGDLPTAVRAVRRGVRELATGRRRLRATLLPTSTMQAMTLGGARRFGVASTAATRLTDELRRVVKPRRGGTRGPRSAPTTSRRPPTR